jgi:formimidoylglutamate deiminase
MVNAHSHAFQRGLRGVSERVGPGGDFWTWRETMYGLARALDPEGMRALAAATYREMAAAGYGAVGEFHYVHHRPDGTPYDEANAMAIALGEAAAAAGLRLVLLPAAYARGGEPRFRDPDVGAFLARVDELRAWATGRPGVSVGVAAHSVRAVPPDWLEAVAEHSERHGLVRHIHASEQPREVAETRAQHRCTPVELLGRTGFLGRRASVVHAIHVTSRDVELLAESGATVVACPTTEGNLGDGYPPTMVYGEAGVPIAVGSDAQVRIDPFEEARELETGARRERLRRFALMAAYGGDLWGELCANGRRSLGLEDEPPRSVAVDLDHPDLAGIEEDDLLAALVTCASAGVVVG